MKFGHATGSVTVETQPVKNTGIVTDPEIGLKWLRGRMRTYRSVIRWNIPDLLTLKELIAIPLGYPH